MNTAVLSLALLLVAPAADLSTGPPLAPVAVPPEAPHGYLYQPARDLNLVPRYPARRYDPQPGDVVLMSDSNLLWRGMYAVALSGAPGHSAIVARMPDGRMGLLEAGFNHALTTRFVPLDYRINHYPGKVWVRPRRIPISPEQDARLTEFALRADNGAYNVHGFTRQITPLRERGPIRTFVLGRPHGPGKPYYCSELVLESLAYAWLINPDRARPAATFPRDMFFDRSLNPYVHCHPPLRDGWEIPSLWTPVVGIAAPGKARPPLDGVWIDPPVLPPPPPRRRLFR